MGPLKVYLETEPSPPCQRAAVAGAGGCQLQMLCLAQPLASVALALVLLPAPSRAAPCTSAMDCSLNGRCTGGKCVCDAAWSGAACEQLALTPPVTVAPAYPPPSWYANTTSWGGSVVREPGSSSDYHMFLAEMAGGWCGLSLSLRSCRRHHLGQL